MYLVEVPVEGGGRLPVQVSYGQFPGDLQLAVALPGFAVTLGWKRPSPGLAVKDG